MTEYKYIEICKKLFFFFQYELYPEYPKQGFSSREEKMLKNFTAKTHNPNIGFDWLKKYFLFQYNYWYKKKPHRPIVLSWIIGDKALLRWNNRNHNWDYFIAINIQKDIYLEVNETITNEKIKKAKLFLQENSFIEEKERKKYFNKEEGLTWCLLTTYLFHPQSPLCQECIHQETCIDLQKNKYFNVYKNRNKKQ